ncbi:MAG: hypothetical protein DMG70_04420 [Acidobacteria bacterium]|nr:MAG: hypothetical protein DMG70_04420 [Acidobacteriota bacterium]
MEHEIFWKPGSVTSDLLVESFGFRTFIRLRELLATHRELARKLEQMEKKYDSQFKAIFEVIEQLMESPEDPERKPIGFAP